MKIFIFEDLGQVSGNYHSEGGLVIIAKDIEEAINLIESDNSISISDKEWSQVEVFDLAGDVEPRFWVMPNAGCC